MILEKLIFPTNQARSYENDTDDNEHNFQKPLE